MVIRALCQRQKMLSPSAPWKLTRALPSPGSSFADCPKLPGRKPGPALPVSPAGMWGGGSERVTNRDGWPAGLKEGSGRDQGARVDKQAFAGQNRAGGAVPQQPVFRL